MKKILIDTDLCCDCDDALALAIANVCHNEKRIELVGVAQCLDDEDCVRFVEKINAYYGNEIPVAKSDCCSFDISELKDFFINALAGEKRDVSYPTSLELTLDALYNNDALTLVYIGQLNDLAQLIERSSEKYKGVEIGELLRTRVEEIVIMAGDFALGGEQKHAEFNIVKDVASARKVFSHGELPITILDFRQGDDVYTGKSVKACKDSPVGQAFYLFCDEHLGIELRSSWDPLTVLYAVFGEGDGFALSKKGTIHVDETGLTSFEEGNGNHRLIYAVDKARLAERIETITKR